MAEARRQQLSSQSSDLWLSDLLPRPVCPHHCVEDRQEFAHAGGQRNCLWLAGRDQAVIEGSNDDVASSGDQRAHVPHGPHGRAPTLHETLASERPAIACEGCDANERGDLLPIPLPEFRQVGEHGAAHDGADARHGAEQVLCGAPDWALLNSVVEIAIDSRDASLEPADVFRDVPADQCAGVLQSIPLGGQHLEELSPPRHEGVELLALGIRERPWRGLHTLGNEREEVGIEPVRLGELPGGFGEVADVARIRHDHGESAAARAETSGVSYPPVASSTMRLGARVRTRSTVAVMPGASFGAVHDVPSGRQATTKSAFAMSTPTKGAVGVIRASTSHGSVLARPCGCGVTPPRHCSGS